MYTSRNLATHHDRYLILFLKTAALCAELANPLPWQASIFRKLATKSTLLKTNNSFNNTTFFVLMPPNVPSDKGTHLF